MKKPRLRLELHHLFSWVPSLSTADLQILGHLSPHNNMSQFHIYIKYILFIHSYVYIYISYSITTSFFPQRAQRAIGKQTYKNMRTLCDRCTTLRTKTEWPSVMSAGKGLIRKELQKWWNMSWGLNNEWGFIRCPRFEEHSEQRNNVSKNSDSEGHRTFWRW